MSGIVRYPVSVVDHKKTTIDPQMEKIQGDIDDINQRLDDDERQYENVFFMGAGDDYTDVLGSACMKPVNKSMKISTNVTCEDGDNVILVILNSFRSNFLRADMNGFEIPFTESTETVDGNLYNILVSENTYQAGTYNIEINQ